MFHFRRDIKSDTNTGDNAMPHRFYLFSCLLGILLVAILAIGGFVALTKLNPCLFASQNNITCSTPIYPGSGVVILKMQRLNKYETASQTMEEKFTYDQDAGSWLHFLGTHEKIFDVYGTVTAGFDLSQLNSNDVVVDQKTGSITLNLPAPEILHSDINLQATHIYDQNTGIDVLWNQNLDQNQQDQILAETRVKMTQDACNENLLQTAASSGKQDFTTMLQSFGFKHVTVNVASGGNCNVPGA